MTIRIRALSLILIAFAHQVSSESECEVLARDPWLQPYLFVPQDATVQIHCTADSPSIWGIDLASDNSSFQYQFERPGQIEKLNAHGVYELPTIETPEMIIVRLLINDTAVNNQTKIVCSSEQSTPILFVFQPDRLVWKEVDMTMNGINISWTQESSTQLAGLQSAYSLMISHGSDSHVISLNESSYYFTPPESAPFCQVYNFSVVASYAGAGADCSEPSPVISRILPPLPDIDEVESSLSYTLTKSTQKGIVLSVSFKQAAYCPNHKYMLVLSNGTSNESTWQKEISMPAPGSSEAKFNTIKAATVEADYLTDNAVITFSLLITNNDHELYTATTQKDIYTTDLQGVRIVVTQPNATIGVTCDFIPGSDAQGCMVVLIGESENMTVNITRDDECTTKILQLASTLSDVFGFDIESDGSISTLAIPGTISVTTGIPLCLPRNTMIQNSPTPGMSWVILITFIAAIALLLVANTAFIIVYCYIKRFPTENKKLTDGEKVEAREAKPKILFLKRKSTSSSLMPDNGTEYCRTSHTLSLQLSPYHNLSDADGAAYAKLPQDNKGHVYHVLERNRRPRGIDVAKDSQTGPPPHTAKITPSTTDTSPPTHKDSTVSTRMPVYDDVILKESQPSSSTLLSTPFHHPDTPPTLPPRCRSTVHCGSETPPKLPLALYDEVLPKDNTMLLMGPTQRLSSPSKLPLQSCDGEESSSDIESPPPLPPPYRDSVVFTCTPLYDEVLLKEVTVQPTGLAPNSDSPSELPSSCDREAYASSSDTECPPPLPPPYRDSAFLMPVYDEVLPKEVTVVPVGLAPNPDSPSKQPSLCDGEASSSDEESPPPLPPPYRDSALLLSDDDNVILEASPAKQTRAESSAVIQGFTSPFLNCDSPPPELMPIHQEGAEN